ncbi:transposase [Streptomyces sp. NPDC056061]|uniref:transposase n=1 Tax=Streptomyces sp. NPDC056061 TaxID=3345700 RepID=UPI0035DB53FE
MSARSVPAVSARNRAPAPAQKPSCPSAEGANEPLFHPPAPTGTRRHCWPRLPTEFGAWSTIHNRFRQWRGAGVFEALLEGLIAEAAKRCEVDLSLGY